MAQAVTAIAPVTIATADLTMQARIMDRPMDRTTALPAIGDGMAQATCGSRGVLGLPITAVGAIGLIIPRIITIHLITMGRRTMVVRAIVTTPRRARITRVVTVVEAFVAEVFKGAEAFARVAVQRPAAAAHFVRVAAVGVIFARGNK